MSVLAGRCMCGLRLDLARGPEHDGCRREYDKAHGVRVCSVCGMAKLLAEFKPRRGACEPCFKERHRVHTRAWYEAHKAEARRIARDSARRSRRNGSASYERTKVQKRKRYRTDPVWRALQLKRFAARRARARAVAA